MTHPLSTTSAPADEPVPLSASDTRFRNWRLLGEGGTATVYKAYDDALGYDVAIKVLRADKLSDPEQRRMLLPGPSAEVTISRRLRHPNICAVHDLYDGEKGIGVVMDIVEGSALRDWMNANADALLDTAPQRLDLLRWLTEALAVAQRVIVHRDLMPENIILRIDDVREPVIMDFGFALLGGKASADSVAWMSHRYAAPEQYLAPETVDRRADLWALGVMAYELFAGEVPPNSLKDVKRTGKVPRIPIDEIEAPSWRNAAVPPALDRIILQLMEYEPDRRFQTAGAVLAALGTVRMVEEGWVGRGAGTSGRRSRAIRVEGGGHSVGATAPSAETTPRLDRPPPSAGPSAGEPVPPQVAVVERRTAATRPNPGVVLGNVTRQLVDVGLLPPARALALSQSARDSGITVFRAVVEDPQARFIDDIYRLVAVTQGLTLIESEKELIAKARATSWLPFAQAERRGAVLLEPEDGKPCYATIDPFDLVLHDWIKRCAGESHARKLVMPSLFKAALQRLKNRDDDDDDDTNLLVIDMSAEEEQRLAIDIERGDIPQIVNYHIQKAVLSRASDIHVEPMEDCVLFRFRVDGILHEANSLHMRLHPELSSRIKIISGMDVAEKRRPQDGRISAMIQGRAIDIRVSSYPTIYGEKMVLRLLDRNALRPSPEDLGMMRRDLRLLYEKLNAPFGLCMISGPTGSGKTTTLYSCLSSVDKMAKNVLTVEDPVEYRLKGVHQMQVNERIGLTFASGLRTILRQDPDVIMVGECRDTETAAMAIQASLTGHIVFSTIHTNDAVGVVTRLLDMGIDHFLVANALTLAIAQRLVRRVCPHCETLVPGDTVRRDLERDGVTDHRLASLGIEIDNDFTYAQGVGCVHCRHTGYLGRRAVFEVFEMTNAARAMILSPNFNTDELRSAAREAGMTTLISHGLQLIEERVTTHAEVIRVLGETF